LFKVQNLERSQFFGFVYHDGNNEYQIDHRKRELQREYALSEHEQVHGRELRGFD
jgi:hypothetical protein